MKHCTLLLVLAAIAGSGTLRAQVPQLINYQGRVVVGTTNYNGTGQFRFALVNANGSTTYWSNDGTSSAGSQPTNAVSLTVSKGLYSVLLGDTSIPNMSVSVPASVFNNSDVRLRVWFDDGTTGSQLLSPDQRIASVGYAAMAANIVDGAVTSAKIANGAIGSAQISNGSVGSSQIASGAVGSSQIADSAVTGAKIGTGQVVKSLNSLKDNVTLAAGSNISITPSGNTLTLAATAGGAGIWSLNGTNAYYNGGSVGVGTSSPKGALQLASGGLAVTGSTSPYTGTTNGIFMESNANAGFLFAYDYASNSPRPLLLNSPGGNVGIGTSTPASPLTLQAFGPGFEQTSGGVRLGTFVDTLGGWLGTISNDKLRFFVNNGGARMTVDTTGNVGIGTTAPSATLHVYDPAGSVTQRIETNGGTNAWSQLRFKNANGEWTVGTSLNYSGDQLYFFREGASINAFAIAPNGDAYVQGIMSCGTLTIRGGADLAEPFQMKEDILEKGSVVVIDEEQPGRLKRSTRAYDRRVAGIISGANGINPGIALQQEGVIEGDQNVALTGRVYVRADASNGAIEPGDLLTTSELPGYAMKVTDHVRAQGAVIGKAMSSLRDNRGAVLVLVTLQ